MGASSAARTYNQNHVPRKYTPGKRRVSIYWTWSYPWECSARPRGDRQSVFHNDGSSPRYVAGLREVRNGARPNFSRESRARWNYFTGRRSASRGLPKTSPAIPSRCSSASIRRVIDCRSMKGYWPTPTLSWCSASTISRPSRRRHPQEIAAIHNWLQREGTCLLLAPHHDVGFSNDLEQRQMEYLHHGDALVPRQQRFGQYTRSLMKALDVPVHNQYGLRPALVPGTKEIAPLTGFRDIDSLGLLKDVPTLNFHLHLPHYELTGGDATSARLLARQPIDLDRPHPFTAAGDYGVQLPAVDATQRAEGRRHRSCGLHELHDALRRY